MQELGPVKVKFERGPNIYMRKQEAQSPSVAKFQVILKFSGLIAPMNSMYNLAFMFSESLFYRIVYIFWRLPNRNE